MKARHLVLFLVSIVALGGCITTESVTRGGATGVDGRALLMIDTASLNAEAASAYYQMLDEAEASGQLNGNQHTIRRLRRIGDRLIRHVGVFRDDALAWGWEINLIDSAELNAFCMPGGKIAFYAGIIDQLDLNDDEIAAIMGHEIAHALREHSNARMSRAIIADTLAMGAGAAIDADLVGLSNLETAKQLLLQLPHSRKHETEADIIGIELAARAGFDPAAAVRVWQKMSAEGGSSVPEFQSTHPSHSTRIQNITNNLHKVTSLYANGAGTAPPTVAPDKSAQAASLRLKAIESERDSFEKALAEIESMQNAQ